MDRSNKHLVAAFAETLREERERLGMTQEDLAARADVSARFISFLETGRRQPSLSTIGAVSVGLGLPMSALIAAVEEKLGYRGPTPDDDHHRKSDERGKATRKQLLSIFCTDLLLPAFRTTRCDKPGADSGRRCERQKVIPTDRKHTKEEFEARDWSELRTESAFCRP